MSKMNIKKADVKPAKPMSIKPKSKSKSQSKSQSKPKSPPVNYDDPNVEVDMYGNKYVIGPDGEMTFASDTFYPF